MKTSTRAILSFCGVLCAGLAIFLWQSRHLGELHRTTSGGPIPRHQETRSTSPATAIPTKSPKQKTALLDRVSEKILASEDIIRIITDYRVATRLARAVVAAKLSLAEEATFKDAFIRFETERSGAYLDKTLTDMERTARLADITRRADEWMSGQLGKERTASFKTEQAAFDRAKAERNATNAISKLSATVNLTSAQKDELFASFLEHELNPPALPTPAMKIVPLFRIDMDPPRPSPGGEMLEILDADQRAALEKANDSDIQAFISQQGAMMEKMLPAFFATLGETSKEEKSPASPK